MSIIQELINEGVLKLYHDYRRRDAIDLSNNNNDGTMTDIKINRKGLMIGGSSTAGVSVSDSPELRLTNDSTIVLFGDFYDNGSATTLIAKDVTEFQLRTISGNLRLFNNTLSNTSTFSSSYTGKKYIGININAGNLPNLYLDGIFASNGNSSFTVSSGSNPLTIGSYGALSLGNSLNKYAVAIIISRVLTASEHAELYGELSSLNYPSKVISKLKGEYPNVLIDGDMELSGVTNWIAANSGVFTKDKGVKYSGTQSMKVTTGGSLNFGFYQGALTVGKEYHIQGYTKSDGVTKPRIYSGSVLWTGVTASGYWQKFDLVFTASNVNIQFYTSTSTGTIWFDNIIISETLLELNRGVKTDFGVNTSDANVTAGFLENTPFEVSTGAWQIVSDTIDSQEIKAIECKGAGILSLDLGSQQTENAYGEWEFWVYKGADANTMNLSIVSDVIGALDGAGRDGYTLFLSSAEAVGILESTNGVVTYPSFSANSYFTINTWYKVKITRSALGEFSYYLDDVLVTAGTGTNPFTDTTTTTSRYIQLDLDVGDKIAYSDITGGHSIIKKVV